MGNVFTLESLREESEKKFAPFVFQIDETTQVVLRNIMQLGKKERETVMSLIDSLNEIQDEANAEDADGDEIDRLIDAVNKVFESVVKVKASAKTLITSLDGNLAMTMTLLEQWMESTQAGEASPSPA